MSLSQELIAKFVKVTNDRTKPQSETTLYGTITEYAGEKYVKLDGSSQLTPISTMSSTVGLTGVKANDRVMVMIKNHTAVITGNTSTPSVNQKDLDDATDGASDKITKLEILVADKVSTDAFLAATGRIDSLETNQLTVNNTLNAQSGTINELKSFNVTVTNTLEAHKGLIDDLDTKKLDAETAKITYASIEKLESIEGDFHTLESTYATFSRATAKRLDTAEATIETLDTTYAKASELLAAEARIGDLETGSAKINTLIFGSATGTSIQTSFSNSVIAQLGDAQIKSAMIENVSAAKITAGDIITDNVRVKSNDGRLIIADQTMQISDANRVRVQIGKDASNDYSINIWDASGNLMFSKGGITDSAIKEAIIRNDMVSDTANIAAYKLDIDSLFEEINGSTNTIKSTKVYLDEQKQTLDVSFKSLSSTVTSQGETITSQGTAISTIQGQITSKVWQQDIDTAKDEMSTQYSALSQDLSGFKTTVGDTYATNTRVSNAETSISQLSDKITANITETTNLGSRMSSVEQTASSLTVKIDDLQVGGRNLLRNSDNAVENSSYVLTQYTYAHPDQIVAGETYTVSFDGMLTDAVQTGFYINTYPSPYKACCTINAISTDGVYHRYKATFNMPDNGSFTTLGVYSNSPGNGKLSGVKNIKLEKGNKATDWTPAPEDIDTDILNASKSATNFMKLDSAGLVVGDMTTSTLGKNVLIASDSVKIRTGTTENAIFGADLIELAKNNASATISMLNGRFKIYYSSDVLEPGLGVYGVTTDGKARLAFQPLNENNNLTLGWGGYNDKANCTNIYGHNINLIAGNDMAFECGDWKINIDGNLFAKASTSEFVELIGLSSDDNTAIGHGGYTAAIGKTNIYGNKIQHIVNTKSGSASYKPYYEAGDSFETEWYGAGFISSGSKVVYFSIPLSKPIIGSTTPNVTVANATTGKGGLQIRQDSNYVFGSSSTEKATPSSYSAKVMGNGNFVQIEATMANTTNAVNNAPCGINANIKITFS